MNMFIANGNDQTRFPESSNSNPTEPSEQRESDRHLFIRGSNIVYVRVLGLTNPT